MSVIMHSEIRKYFAERGVIYDDAAVDEYVDYYQFINNKYIPIALWTPEDEWRFRFDESSWVSEEEALHLIKLKAFM